MWGFGKNSRSRIVGIIGLWGTIIRLAEIGLYKLNQNLFRFYNLFKKDSKSYQIHKKTGDVGIMPPFWRKPKLGHTSLSSSHHSEEKPKSPSTVAIRQCSSVRHRSRTLELQAVGEGVGVRAGELLAVFNLIAVAGAGAGEEHSELHSCRQTPCYSRSRIPRARSYWQELSSTSWARAESSKLLTKQEQKPRVSLFWR